jgi:hypothetical protein
LGFGIDVLVDGADRSKDRLLMQNRWSSR